MVVTGYALGIRYLEWWQHSGRHADRLPFLVRKRRFQAANQ